MGYLVLVRHGQTEWNEDERFTGWTDIPINSHGEAEMVRVSKTLMGYRFDICYSSSLLRTQQSLKIILDQLGQSNLTHFSDHALNERDYGDLTGQTHSEAITEYGKNQFDLWHRSWDTAPPHGESLKDTYLRVIPYFETQILPELKKGKNVLVVSSGNSLRALIKKLKHLNEKEISTYQIPTGSALIFQVTKNGSLIEKS